MAIIPLKDFDVSKIKYSDKIANRSGGQMVFVNYGTSRDKLFFQSPFMKLPFGVNEYIEDSGKKTMSMVVSFQGQDSNPNIQDAYDKMLAFDQHVLDAARDADISKKWFGETKDGSCTKSVGRIEDDYQKMVKEAKDEKYSDNMKLKIPIDENGVPQIEIYDTDNTAYEATSIMEVIPKGCEAQVIFGPNLIYWIGKSMWGVSLKAIGIRFKAKHTMPTGLNMFLAKEEGTSWADEMDAHDELGREGDDGAEEEDDVEYVEEEEVEEPVEPVPESAPAAKKSRKRWRARLIYIVLLLRISII